MWWSFVFSVEHYAFIGMQLQGEQCQVLATKEYTRGQQISLKRNN